MSIVKNHNPEHKLTAPPPVQRYVKRRDRLSDAEKQLSRRAQRRILDVSQTYWAVEQDQTGSESDRKRRWRATQSYGDFSMAYSTAVQPLMEYHELAGVDGHIAFRRKWGVTFALADPVVSDENKADLIDSFCEQHRRVSFCQVSESTAEILAARGFYLNELGVDTTLDLPSYDFSGKEKEWLRYANNWTNKRGYVVKELDFDGTDETELDAVSEAWRKTRTIKRKEVRFINRPIIITEPEPHVRKFYLFDPNRRLLAFVFMDPFYRDGKILGYVTAFKRRHPDAPKYAESSLMKTVIEKLKVDGVQQLKLGLSPGAWLEDQKFKHNWCTAKLFRTMFNSRLMNRYFYNLVGHAHYKRRFRGREEKVYFASDSRFNSRRLVTLLSVCGLA